MASFWRDSIKGQWVITRDDGQVLTLPIDTPQDEVDAKGLDFLGPDLSMPDEIPMDRLRLFLISTNRLGQVTAFLASLPDPNRALAESEFEYAPAFVPTAALGRACQAALGLSDADYAEAVRDAAAFSIEDYGDPKPTLLKALGKFLWGGS